MKWFEIGVSMVVAFGVYCMLSCFFCDEEDDEFEQYTRDEDDRK